MSARAGNVPEVSEPQPSRRSDVPPFQVMQVLADVALRQATHGDVIALCVGQPATPAPGPALAAARRALDGDVMGYTQTPGRRTLREAIAGHYARCYGLEVDPDEVVATTGSSGGFSSLLLAAFEPGARIAMTRPGYPAYRNTALALGLRPVDLDCSDTRYQPTVPLLESLPDKPDGLVVASPANPTGTVVDPDQLAALAAWCAANDCLLMSDEIYHGISFEGRCASAWEFDRDAVVIGSVSKYFSMTGYRLGWLLAPPALRRRIDLLQGNLAICAPTISQVAATGALGPAARPELDGHVDRYRQNRSLLLRRLPELGITDLAPPDGAFYAYCNVSHLTGDSLAWCAQVLARTGVALTPGVDFDPVDGHHSVRFSFCGTSAQIDEAMDRLVAMLG